MEKGARDAIHEVVELPHLLGVMSATSGAFAGLSQANHILEQNFSTPVQSLKGAWSVLPRWVE
jgi:hypothetical protein